MGIQKSKRPMMAPNFVDNDGSTPGVAWSDVTGTQAGVEAAVAGKTEIAALATIATDADLPTAVAAINAVIAALKAA